MRMKNGLVLGVIIRVYNQSQFLKESIDSIIKQTLKPEIIVIYNDGSNDGSYGIISQYEHLPNVVVVNNGINKGLPRLMNDAYFNHLFACDYIAHMDADDISLPTRFEKQLEFMDKHPEVVVCGTQYKVFGKNLRRKNTDMDYPLSDEDIKFNMIKRNPIGNGSAIVKMDFINEHKIKYNTACPVASDYEIWTSIFEAGGIFANIPDRLYKYRIHPDQMTRTKKQMYTLVVKSIKNRIKLLTS